MSGTRIQLSPETTAEIEARIDGTEFDSPEEYVRFILREVLDTDADTSTETAESTVEGSDLEDRLADLGYL
jgi:Arc/MetJ-type ribon-helix-helix transcriptional regulator